jgi:NAD(P)-dependent dehydrogenase (short-subunit alcohol dehydrogenase family)
MDILAQSPIDLFRLTGKVALVAGGTSGIGRQIALGLAGAGSEVVACGRRAEAACMVASELARIGVGTFTAAADITNQAQMDELLESIVERFGRIDVLVNSAGAHLKKPALDVTPQEWDYVQDSNLKATYFLCQKVCRIMREQGSGAILNIASMTAFADFQETSVYGISKAGVVQLTRSLAVEWAKYGIRVNAIAPGVFITPMNEALLNTSGRGQRILERTPMGRFGELEELVGTAIYLVSEASRFVTGVTVPVDGGFLAKAI